MTKRIPIEPIIVAPLFSEMRAELLTVLKGLRDEEWELPTACAGWTVRDVALHIPGDDVGQLSGLRDRDGQHKVVEGWDELVAFINAQNDLWVKAARRMSRRLLISLLGFTGQQWQEHVIAIDPYVLSGPIGWAGNQPDPMWLHLARELTEYWMHHQHICEAVGKTSLKTPRFLRLVLSAFVHALPRTYSQTDAPPDTVVKLVISGEGGGAWHLVRDVDRWKLYADTDLMPAATVSFNTDTAWRLFTKGIDSETVRRQTTIDGDITLGEVLLNTVAIIA
jgi:uncharacterized protein (TIGR03083 family)